MSIKSTIIHHIEKSNLLSKAYLKFSNKINIKESNILKIKCIHFKSNTINLFGHNCSLNCLNDSFLSNYTATINGNENTVFIKQNSKLYGNEKAIYISGNNNKIIIGENCHLRSVNFFISGDNNIIEISDNCSMNDVELHIEQNHNTISIENGCTFHGRGARNIHIAADEGSKIIFHEDCMISNDIQIRSTDSHSIIDESGKRINPAKDIIIGKHCWLGLGAIILKGTQICDNTVIAAGAVCSKVYDESNCVLAGNPAKVVKHNVNWDRKFL